ncbi:nif11-like leader peptide domain-containing protein [Eubacterium ruminantium]|nr:nif11-like leader peptide domain-containing protein [Eubacterium ruminantium]
MSVENVAKFKKDLQENAELREKIKNELEAAKDSGKDEKEILPEIAGKLGYDFTEEEFKEGITEKELNDEELNPEELENVSGGILWMGDKAPDGYEIGCFMIFYLSWQDYYHQKRICENCKTTNTYYEHGDRKEDDVICRSCGHRTKKDKWLGIV